MSAFRSPGLGRRRASGMSGWDYRLGRDGGDFHALVFVFGRMNEHSDGWEMCPDSIARAWLLAILKALRATPGAGDDQGSA